MTRKFKLILLLTAFATGAWAQNWLSQGQAVKNTTPNPTQTRKTCSECGITMYNVTYPWQHKDWCPYYRSQGSSRKSSSSSNYAAYTAADAGISALGSVLSSLVASAFEPRASKSKKSSAPDYPVLSAEELADRKLNQDYWIDKIFEDRECWEYGDYVIALDGEYFPGCGRVVTLKNKKTGEYILGPFDSKTAQLLKKDKFPAYNRLITQLSYDKEKYKEYAHSSPYNVGHFNAGRIKFFDSSKQHTPKELDGLLFIDGRWSWPNPEGKKGTTQFSHVSGIYQIEGNELKPVLKLDPAPAPFVGERFELYKNYGIFRFWHQAKSKWTEESAAQRKNVVVNFMMSKLYSLDGKLLRKDIVHLLPSADSSFIWCLDYETMGGSLRDFQDNKRAFSDYCYSAVDKDMNPVPRFKDFDYLAPVITPDRTLVIAGSKEHFGVINENGQVIIPLMYDDPVLVRAALKVYEKISFTNWYKHTAEHLTKTKGEFEKQAHFDARMHDAELQKAYLTEKMQDAENTYLNEMKKKGVSISLGKYDSESETFPIHVKPAAWNGFAISVPIAEAEAFKASFDDIKAEALKNATFGIRNDAISIQQITFTLPSGKSYTFQYKSYSTDRFILARSHAGEATEVF